MVVVPLVEITAAYPVPFPNFASGRKGYGRAVVYKVGDRYVVLMSDDKRDLSHMLLPETRLYLTNSVEHFAAFVLWTVSTQADSWIAPKKTLFIQYFSPQDGYPGEYNLVSFGKVEELPGWGWKFAKPVWKRLLEVDERTEQTDLRAVEIVAREEVNG